MTPTHAQLEAAIAAAATVYQLIATHGASGVPSGHLYALTMNAFADVASFEACIGLLVRGNLVRREGLVLVAIVV